jgi:hypothetical protein
MRALLVAGVCVLDLIAVGVVTGTADASPAQVPFSFSTNPPLQPAFSPSVSDYVVRCAGSSTTALSSSGSGNVHIGGTSVAEPANVNLSLVPGQDVKVTHKGATYYVRCLPSDFPNFTSSVTGTPQASGYLVTIGNYAAVFDTQGVPIWWLKGASGAPIDAKFLSPNVIGFSNNNFQLHRLDGSLIRTVGSSSVILDFHDFQQLPNGNYLGFTDVMRPCSTDPSQCVDLSSWGLSNQSSVLDNVIVELNRKNQVVWQWSTVDHIDVAAENVNWRDQFPDVIHMNSIEYDGNGGIIFSARHLDAVYRIDMTTGDVTWKLGGSPTPESLTVAGDQYAQLFSGQHYARLLPDGSLTVHDNGSRANRPPRALRFTLDLSAGTATEVEQVTDPRATAAPFVGSAERLAGGDWVMSWGDNDFVTELNPQGVPQLTITYPGYFSYREADVLASVSALRQGMDAQVPPLTGVSS